MNTKFSEDIVPVTTLKAKSAKIIRQVSEGHRPVLLTSRGRGVAVVQSLGDYERLEEERAFMKAVVQGLKDIEQGRTLSVAEAKARYRVK
jgi:prevent-host-death family protein